MVEKSLEIRGIHREKIISYVQEIKAILHTKQIEDPWDYSISREETFHLLHSEIPKVYITFSAATPALLEHILKEFRLKTLRAGA